MFIITDTNLYSDGAHIAFLLDVSRGVNGFDFFHQMFFVEDVMTSLRSFSTRLNAAVVKYSDEATLLVNFTQRFDFDLFFATLFYKFDFTFNPHKWQRIDKALIFTSKHVFVSTGQNIPKIAILVASGKYPRPAFDGKASESLKQKGVRIFVVDVNSRNPKELLSITEREDDLIQKISFNHLLRNSADNLVNKILLAIGKY